MTRAGGPAATAAAGLSVVGAWAADVAVAASQAAPGADLAGAITSYGLLPSTEPMPLAAGACACCGVWLAWARLAARGNERPGEEHGSARWASPREVRALADRTDPDNNILLTRRVSLAMSRADHDPDLERNRNVLVVGGSGSGKTRSYVIPNLLQCNASYVVTDPKAPSPTRSAPPSRRRATRSCASTPWTSRAPCATTRSPTSAPSRTSCRSWTASYRTPTGTAPRRPTPSGRAPRGSSTRRSSATSCGTAPRRTGRSPGS